MIRLVSPVNRDHKNTYYCNIHCFYSLENEAQAMYNMKNDHEGRMKKQVHQTDSFAEADIEH